MTRSSDSLVPSASGQPDPEKRDDKALTCWQEGEANLRAATEVNAVTASSYPPAIMPIQLDLFPGRACPLEAKPATDRNAARVNPDDTSTVTAARFPPGSRKAYDSSGERRTVQPATSVRTLPTSVCTTPASPGAMGGWPTQAPDGETSKRPRCAKSRGRRPTCTMAASLLS